MSERRGFDLLGAHAVLQCASCHNLPDYSLLFEPPPASDQACIVCHQSDYDNEHAGSDFPTTCLDCHNTNNWANTTQDCAPAGGAPAPGGGAPAPAPGGGAPAPAPAGGGMMGGGM